MVDRGKARGADTKLAGVAERARHRSSSLDRERPEPPHEPTLKPDEFVVRGQVAEWTTSQVGQDERIPLRPMARRQYDRSIPGHPLGVS